MKILITLMVLTLPLATFAADAPTAATATTHKNGGPCQADREKFCKGVKPGHGDMIKCMQAHKDELSDGCKAMGQMAREKMKARGSTIREACGTDLGKFCKDSKSPRDKMQCLRAHSADITPACQAALPPAKKK